MRTKITEQMRRDAIARLPFTDEERERGGLSDALSCETVGKGWGGDYSDDKPGSFAYEARREDDLYLLSRLMIVSIRAKWDALSQYLAPLSFAAAMPHARAKVSAAKCRAAMRKFWECAVTIP
jgi:hypothetical protein